MAKFDIDVRISNEEAKNLGFVFLQHTSPDYCIEVLLNGKSILNRKVAPGTLTLNKVELTNPVEVNGIFVKKVTFTDIVFS